MSFRFSGLAANHFPRRSSESAYSSARWISLALKAGQMKTYPYPKMSRHLVRLIQESQALIIWSAEAVKTADTHQAQA
jgi:hypothetical protein